MLLLPAGLARTLLLQNSQHAPTKISYVVDLLECCVPVRTSDKLTIEIILLYCEAKRLLGRFLHMESHNESSEDHAE